MRRAYLLVFTALLGLAYGQSSSQPTLSPQTPTPFSVSEIAKASLSGTVVVHSYISGKPLSLGSGFISTKDGKIITNFHVISGADAITVKLQDGGLYEVEGIIGVDQNADLAVLKLKATGREFAILPLGSNDRTTVGDSVIAIGNPMGLEGTVSTGIISGKRLSTDVGLQTNPAINLLQVTAPISPGSSGGALLNSKGEVIGIPFVQVVGGQNLNFAVPIEYAMPLLALSKVLPVHELARAETSKRSAQPIPSMERRADGIEGTYTGVWQSSRFSVSGAATMRVTVQGASLRADIFLTGSEISSEVLTGEATNGGNGVWTVTLRAQKKKLSVKGIFRDGTFVGDYDYRHFMLVDKGQWLVRKN